GARRRLVDRHGWPLGERNRRGRRPFGGAGAARRPARPARLHRPPRPLARRARRGVGPRAHRPPHGARVAADAPGLGRTRQRRAATGLAPAACAAALRAGGDAAYVLSLRRRVFDVCRAALELPPWSWTATVEPLLDVRPHALVRRGLPPLQLDWDGTPHITP